MAESAEKQHAPQQRRDESTQRSEERHDALERRGDLSGYDPLLNGRSAGPRPVQPAPNRTGLPDRLKAGIEALSGLSMDKVNVHYNSSKPAELGARAYAQGTDIHLGTGQERHLPHEAWHLVQQAQGRVKPTMQMKRGVSINDDTALEREADMMGMRASNRALPTSFRRSPGESVSANRLPVAMPLQLKPWLRQGGTWVELDNQVGPKPTFPEKDGVVVDWFGQIENLRLYASRESYQESKAQSELKNPPFKKPDFGDAATPTSGTVDAQAAHTLRGFLREGIKTPGELGAAATSSGDKKRRPDDVSVNVIAKSGNAAAAKHYAQFFTTNAANGAIPVLIEQKGDQPTGSPDIEALTDRARASALAVIDPAGLKPRQKQTIATLSDVGGEATVEGSIPSSNFVVVFVPAEFRHFFMGDDLSKIQFVGSVTKRVSYNVIEHESTLVDIRVPNYEAALSAILMANPQHVFVTHAIRLGRPNPLGLTPQHPSVSTGASAGSSASAVREPLSSSSVAAAAPAATSAASSSGSPSSTAAAPETDFLRRTERLVAEAEDLDGMDARLEAAIQSLVIQEGEGDEDEDEEEEEEIDLR